jgi:hypothetical protein
VSEPRFSHVGASESNTHPENIQTTPERKTMTTQEIAPQIDQESFSGDGGNTEIGYLYRDADNYKQHATAVLPGALAFPEAMAIMAALDDGEYFVPSGVGLADLQERMRTGWDPRSDHPFHALTGIGLTADEPTETTTAAEFAERFLAADWKAEEARVSAAHA